MPRRPSGGGVTDKFAKQAYAKKIGEFLCLCKKFSIAYFSRRGIKKWFWDTMMVKVSDAYIYNDPNVRKLMTNPLEFLESNMPRKQKKIPGGWDFPYASLFGAASWKTNTKKRYASLAGAFIFSLSPWVFPISRSTMSGYTPMLLGTFFYGRWFSNDLTPRLFSQLYPGRSQCTRTTAGGPQR